MMPGKMAPILALLLSGAAAAAQPVPFTSPLDPAGQDKWVTVPLEAVAQTNPPAITLRAHRTERAYSVFRKGPHDLTWSVQMGTIPGGNGTWTDTNVVVGQEYEYRVYGGTVTGQSGTAYLYGYIRAGAAVDMTGWRGRVALVVENQVSSNLVAALQQYIEDLTGDGWTVHVINTPRGEGYGGMGGTGFLHVPIRDQIIALHTNHPGEVKHVALLGNVPQPRTALFYSGPDGHGDEAAFGTDAYYGELDGTWTDTGSNSAIEPKRNIPGDGKYDQTRSPANDREHVELGFGRMDMTWLSEGPLESLRNYLDKLHRYKHAAPDFRPGRRSMLREGFDNVGETAWNSMPALVGLENMEYSSASGTANFKPYDLDQRYSEVFGPYLFYFKGNAMPMRGMGGRGVFWTGLQSRWGYWYQTDQMAKALAEDSFTLSITWSIWGTRYFYHRMGLGDVAGDMMKWSINNRGWSNNEGLHRIDSNYWPNGEETGALFMNHLGDPLLRLYMFPPAAHLAAVPGPAGVALTWTASEDAEVAGYHVYRSTAMNEPFARLTTSPLAATSYSDTSVSSGTHVYMVRAVKLETTGSGTFWNGSQGIFATANFSTPAPLSITTTSPLPRGFPQFPYEVALAATGGIPPYAWSVISGAPPAGISLAASGLLSGSPRTSGSTHFVVHVADAAGATNTLAFAIDIASGARREFTADADAGVNSNGTPRTYNFGANRNLILAGATPIATSCDTVFLRFRITPPAGNTVSGAVLRLRPTEISTSTSADTITVRLVDDDAWVEGDHEGTVADNIPAGELIHTNRPALNTNVVAVTTPATVNPFAAWEADVTSLVNGDLATDTSGVVTLQLTLSAKNFSFATHESLVARLAPRLVVDYASAGPEIELLSPVGARAILAPGQALHLSADARHPTLGTGQLTSVWSVIKFPSGATASVAPATGLEAIFEADREGAYTVRLGVSDGIHTTVQDVAVQIISATLPSSVLPPEILHYPLDESTGTLARNLAGGPDGQLTNFTASGGWITGGRHGGALDLTADSNSTLRAHIRALAHADYDFSLSRPWTVSFWVRTTQTLNRDIVGKARASTTEKQLRIRHESSNNRAAVVLGGTSTETITYDRFRLNDGTWRLMTLVNDPATPSAILFIDGGFTQYATLGSGAETTTEDFLIGSVRNASSTDTAGDFDGQIDDVRVYDRALTWAEVRALALGTPFNRAPILALRGPSSPVVPDVAAAFSATVVDDGLPNTSAPALRWEKVSGPGDAVFSSPGTNSTSATFSAPGAYFIRLVADDGQAVASVEMAVSVQTAGSPGANAPPQVDAGPNRSTNYPGVVTLSGSATDDGNPGPLVAQWTQLSGPGAVVFANPTNPATTVSLRGDGKYILQLTASDGELTSSAIVHLHVGQPENEAPVIDAGTNFTHYVSSPVILQATATDDGNPDPPGTLTYAWSRFNGPTNVVFSNPAALNPHVTFDATGSYTLRLQVSDGLLTNTDFVVVTVTYNPAGNQTPVAAINEADVYSQFPDTVFLTATVSDDGLPNPPGAVTTTWSKVSGPGDIVVNPATPAGTYALNVTTAGQYVVRLAVSDGVAETSDTVNATFDETARHRLIWAWGRSRNGEAGPFTGADEALDKPVIVGRGWTKPLPGDQDGLALVRKSGTVLATGRTNNFLLGDPSAPARSYFAQVPGLSNLLDLASATEAAAALHADGTVSTWGKSGDGSLGNGIEATSVTTPTRLSSFSGVRQLFGRNKSFYALKNDGSLWAWGYNSRGKLGNGPGGNVLVPTEVAGLSNVLAVAPGDMHTVYLKTNGTVVACGYNYLGSVGDGTSGFDTDRYYPVPVVTSTNPSTPLTGIRKVVAGAYHTLALDESGRVWAWGYNNGGQLGQDHTENVPVATLVLDSTASGTLTGVVDIAASSEASFALMQDGSVLGWGADIYNLFGEGQMTYDRWLPEPVSGLPPKISAIWADIYTAYAATPWATYEDFLADHFSAQEIAAGQAAPGHDFEGDGSANLFEYATGGDPRQSDPAGAPAIGRSGGRVFYETDVLTTAEDLTFHFEGSSVLSGWSPANPASTSAEDRGDFDRVRLQFDIPSSAPLFLRTKATRTKE